MTMSTLDMPKDQSDAYLLAAKSFKPIADKILVMPIEDEKITSPDGETIVLADDVRKKPMRGIVVAVGPGPNTYTKRDMETKPFDIVAFGKYAGQDLTIGGKTFIVMFEAEVLGIHVRVSS